jgi:hypothetical protein
MRKIIVFAIVFGMVCSFFNHEPAPKPTDPRRANAELSSTNRDLVAANRRANQKFAKGVQLWREVVQR